MGFFEILFIGVGLAMDAFAVSICRGLQMRHGIHLRHTLLISGFFGGFQALMPILGWLLGRQFEHHIKAVDHWIAFALLSVIGGKMIFDAIQEAKEECQQDYAPTEERLDLRQLCLMAVATSIDALAVGVSFALYDVNVLQAALTIGLITFALCLVGVVVGNRFGTRYKSKAAILGGVVLLLIGVKILLQDLGILHF